MNDRNGNDYSDLVRIQEVHLALWKEKLRTDLYKEVAAYVRTTNAPARKTEEKHQVYRGQDIVQLILDWPAPSAAYLPRQPDALI